MSGVMLCVLASSLTRTHSITPDKGKAPPARGDAVCSGVLVDLLERTLQEVNEDARTHSITPGRRSFPFVRGDAVCSGQRGRQYTQHHPGHRESSSCPKSSRSPSHWKKQVRGVQ